MKDQHGPVGVSLCHARVQKPVSDTSVGFVGTPLASVELTLHSERRSQVVVGP